MFYNVNKTLDEEQLVMSYMQKRNTATKVTHAMTQGTMTLGMSPPIISVGIKVLLHPIVFLV